jgi:rubredoxin
MSKPDLSRLPVFGSYGWVQCPSCGNQSLHHKGVCITDRLEDAETGPVVVVQGIGDWDRSKHFDVRFINDANMLFNPSPRRGGILIEFCCEHCDAEPQLGIYQHKGTTLIEWFDLGLPEPEPEPEPEPIKRQPIKPSLRFEILKRDNYRCQMCGVTAKDGATLEIDHIHPVSKGGTNEPDNLQVLCRECNAGKGAQCQ